MLHVSFKKIITTTRIQLQFSSMAEATKYAVVTGANRGIGLEICRQLAAEGMTVVLTARNDKKGLEAVKKLGGSSGLVMFHQLDVTDFASIAALAAFIESRIGKLDLLINNAGIHGALVNGDVMRASLLAARGNGGVNINWNKIMSQTYDSAVEGLRTNYYGAKRTTEALLPLLFLSDSPRVVNVSAEMGKLKNIHNEWAKSVLKDDESLTEDKIDLVIREFLRNVKDGAVESEGWPHFFAAYTVSKAAMNAYTKLAAKRYPRLSINSVCPGYVRTDINFNTGRLTVEEGAESPVRVALLPHGGPSGMFFVRDQVSSFVE